MTELKPSIETMKISDVRVQLDTLIDRVHHQQTQVVIEKSGIPVAAIVSPEDLDRWQSLDRKLYERRAVIDEMRAAFKDVPQEELEREAAKALTEVRAEMRAERARAAENNR